jgi:endonuclease YncB( thermonuclease family)
MNQKTLSIAALIGSAILALAPAFPVQAAGRRPSDILAYTPEAGQVTNVIDGQTIQVALSGGPTVTVQYVGITAPTGSDCGAWQAKNDNTALMLGNTVRMEKDALATSPDGSVLYRYVYLLNATMANEEMIKNGDAMATTATPNIKHQGTLNDLEAQTRTSGAGGWSTCGWKSTVAKAAGTCVTITAEALYTRVDKVPEVGLLHDGDCVTIYKAENQDGPAWSGQYIYHPAGTVIGLAPMYFRWKDGMVSIHVDSDGAVTADVVRHTKAKYFAFGTRTIIRDAPSAEYPESQYVVPDPGMSQMLQIQNPRAWLMQDLGNGIYKALTDVFVYKSGDYNVVYYGGYGGLH